MKLLFIILSILTSQAVFSQIAIGEWRDHLPYSKAIDLTDAEDKIYCATETSIFSYSKTDNSLSKLSKVNGLSDIGIKCINYYKEKNTLFVGYSNGNIDLIKNGKSINISDIKRKLMLGEKSINNVLFINNYAYLSTGFGIVVLDIDKEEIKDTYYIGNQGTKININEITTDGQTLYAATEKGIYSASLAEPFLTNFEKWTHISNIPNSNSAFNAIAYINKKIYFNFDSETAGADTTYIYYLDSLNWKYLDTLNNYTTYSISSFNNKLIVVGNILNISDSLGNLVYFKTSLNLANTTNMRNAIFDNYGTFWLSDYNNGLVKQLAYSSFERYFPNGPSSANAVSIDASDSKLWTTIGAMDGSWNSTWKHAELNYFENNTWTTKKWSGTFTNIYDIVKIKISPSDSKRVYFAAWGDGVIEFYDNNLVNKFDETNSSLQSIFPGQKYCRIGGIAFDENENLWATNTGVNNPISVKTSTGDWKSFNYGNVIPVSIVLGDIIVTKNNHKWVFLARGGGLFAFDEKETFDDISDDDLKKFSVVDENNELITNDIFSIAEDKNGVIWIGTNMGIIAYYYPENVFSGDNFYAQRIIIPSEIPGQANYLLKNETVTAIIVDGANRKWIGTEKSGVFLMSEDMSYEIHHFTSENSPLISDNIISIAVDNKSGEVFFGTEKGVVSYRGTATEGSENNENVFVYPNPVKDNYSGLITVTGLVTNSNVKITDIHGNLVYETIAEGGQATWDGRNFSGNRVQTGVYLVFSTNDDGTKTNITKILFIN